MSLSRRSFLAAVGSGASGLLLARRLQATCAAPRPIVVLVTPVVTPIPPDGGLLVSMSPAMLSVPGMTNLSAYTGAGTMLRTLPDTLSLRRAGATFPLRRELLSPSLARYMPAHPPPEGTYELVGAGRAISVQYTSAATSRLNGPEFTRIRVETSSQQRIYGGAETGRTAYIETAGALHAEPLVLLVRWNHPSADGVHAWFGNVSGSRLPIWNTFNGHCGRFPVPGESAPRAGSTASYQWVDVWGRLTGSWHTGMNVEMG